VPSNTGSDTVDIGDDVRVSKVPGYAVTTIERRVDNGLFGTGIGAKWENLPVDARVTVGPDGQEAVAIDRSQLERAIGAEATDKALRTAGIAMAKPPSKEESNDEENRGVDNRSKKRDPNEPDQDGSEPPPPHPPSGRSSESQADNSEQRREIREIAEHIGAGHAASEHLEYRREYPGLSYLEFVDLIENVMRHPTHDRDLPNSGRKAYWDSKSQLLVIKDPTRPDKGTAFKHPNGPAYMKTMIDR
jgi:hypothetical protein